MDTLDSRPCHACGSHKKKTLPCGGCKSVYYCSKEHQKQDWVFHRSSCRYYKRVQTPFQPSHLVATRKIPKGTIIFKSEAIAVGPNGLEPVCFGCLRPLIYDVMSYQCEGCGWPIDVQCEKSPLHQLECSAFQKAGFHLDEKELWKDWTKEFKEKFGLSILVLRVLLSNQLETILKLHRPGDLRALVTDRETQMLVDGVSSCIRNTFRLQQFEHDTICNVSRCILSVLIPVNGLADTYGLFEKRHGIAVHDSDVAYIKHSCFPNVDFIETLQEPTTVLAIANVDIKCGQILAANRDYSSCGENLFLPTWLRHLSTPCACLRCTDPTELGLHIGSMMCKKCFGMITPDRFNWVCIKCHKKFRSDKITHTLQQLEKSLDFDCNHPNDVVKFIDAHSGPDGPLHAGHYLIFRAKNKYCSLIFQNSNEKGAAYDFGTDGMDRFSNYTNDIISVKAKLNQHGKREYYILLQVRSRYIIHQWVAGNITNEQALESINGVIFKDIIIWMTMTMTNLVDRNTWIQHESMQIEVLQHLSRLVRDADA